MEKKGYTISDIYSGGYSSLSPEYSDLFMDYRISSKEVGSPTSIQTANQLKEVMARLNEGTIPIELQPINPEVFDQIPKQHFKEINRLSKLTGAKMSIHAPVIEPTGITKEGWNESSRELSERQLKEVVARSLELSDKERLPITIHSTAIPGSEVLMEKGKKKTERIIAINQDNYRMVPIEEEEIFYPMRPKRDENDELVKDSSGNTVFCPVGEGEKLSPEHRLESHNASEWDQNVANVLFYKDNADKIITQYGFTINEVLARAMAAKKNGTELLPTEQEVLNRAQLAHEYLKHTELTVNSLFDKAYRFSDKEDKEKLKKVAEEYREMLGDRKSMPLSEQSKAMQHLIDGLYGVNPRLNVPIEEFALDKSTQTFSNVAWDAYKKATKEKKPLPMINIENMFTGMTFASGKEMNELITKTRDKFVEKAKSEGMNEGQASKLAEDMIGMTLDVGHLNIFRKKGFEDKDLIKEVEQISKFVKHVHLTDNFGFSDSHIPPGMGNVPTKKIMEELEKQGFKGNKIVEAGAFVQHFQTSPFSYTLEALGSPIAAGYNWNQISNTYGGYFGGYGMMLPSINYETFGAGFSQLPSELGGQRGGGARGSRMSGRPME